MWRRSLSIFDGYDQRTKLKILVCLVFIAAVLYAASQLWPEKLFYMKYVPYVMSAPIVLCFISYVKARNSVNQVTEATGTPPGLTPTDSLPPASPPGPQPSRDNRGTLNNTHPYPNQESVGSHLPPPPPFDPNSQQGIDIDLLPPPPSYDEVVNCSQQSW